MSRNIYAYECEVCGDTECEGDITYTEKKECTTFGHVYDIKHSNGKVNSTERLYNVVLDYTRADGVINNPFEVTQDCFLRNRNVAYIIKKHVEEAFKARDYYSGSSSVFCPICNLQALSDSDVMRYLLFVAGKTKKTVVDEIKKKYGDYKTFNKAIPPGLFVPAQFEHDEGYEINLRAYNDEHLLLVVLSAAAGIKDERLFENSLSIEVMHEILVKVALDTDFCYDFTEDSITEMIDNYFPSVSAENLLTEVKKIKILRKLS